MRCHGMDKAWVEVTKKEMVVKQILKDLHLPKLINLLTAKTCGIPVFFSLLVSSFSLLQAASGAIPPEFGDCGSPTATDCIPIESVNEIGPFPTRVLGKIPSGSPPLCYAATAFRGGHETFCR